jgi:hypothetical protein
MSNAIVVRYSTKPESAAENERLVRDVYEELAKSAPEGFHYLTVCLDDGVSFVHLAIHDEGADNPLPETEAFQRFQAGLASRLTEGPIPAPATVVGTYGFIEGTN